MVKTCGKYYIRKVNVPESKGYQNSSFKNTYRKIRYGGGKVIKAEILGKDQYHYILFGFCQDSNPSRVFKNSKKNFQSSSYALRNAL